MSERVVAVEGSLNFRDFGGYVGAEGRRLKQGALYRCGNLAGVTRTGIEQFEALGVARLCDLRRVDECEEDPTALHPDRPERVHIPMDPASAVMIGQSLQQDQQLGVDGRVQFMCDINYELVTTHLDDYRRYVETLLNTDDGGFLVHCTAGKDRTGVAVAIVQLALGVSQDDIMADYLLTNEVLDFEGYMYNRLRERYGVDDVDPEEVRALAGVRRDYLDTAFRAMDEAFEGPEGYLRALGLDDAARAELVGRYLEV